MANDWRSPDDLPMLSAMTDPAQTLLPKGAVTIGGKPDLRIRIVPGPPLDIPLAETTARADVPPAAGPAKPEPNAARGL